MCDGRAQEELLRHAVNTWWSAPSSNLNPIVRTWDVELLVLLSKRLERDHYSEALLAGATCHVLSACLLLFFVLVVLLLLREAPTYFVWISHKDIHKG